MTNTTKTKSAYLTVKEDGTIVITRGLVFHGSDVAINIEESTTPPVTRTIITENVFIGTHPKWWNVIGWVKIMQLVAASTRRESK
jgi:hypothetical protein